MKIIASNWKMNGTHDEIHKYFKDLCLEEKNLSKTELIFALPFTLLYEALKINRNYFLKIFAQNCCYHSEDCGLTGEISTKMLSSIGVHGTILGHSERKQFGETLEVINMKIKSSLDEKLKVIFCIGETYDDYIENKTEEVIKYQIEKGLKNVKNLENIIFAYEPIWAINSNSDVDFENIRNISNLVKKICIDTKSYEPKIIYGGSVNLYNFRKILDIKDISGILVGKASLDSKKFSKMI
ncbi:MAG: triose-phosphate isomerase [Firmicutes bacterium]|nr:triose-phosphate isomerase [Bacillota bacterium]